MADKKIVDKTSFCSIEDNQMGKQIGRWAHPYSTNVNKIMPMGEQYSRFEDF
jgi:hypothetical protein